MLGQVTHVGQSPFFVEAEKKAQVPFLHHIMLESTCDDLEYIIADHDITIRIPKGAVPYGKKIHLEIGVALYGPFYFPENTQPISPILWICLLEEDTNLMKPFQIIFPHFLNGLTTQTAQLHKCGFVKASHNNYAFDGGQMSYHFLPCEEDLKVASNKSKHFGILQTNHCCFYCIQANISSRLAVDADYCLVSIIRSNSLNPKVTEINFVAIFFMDTCLKVQ